MKNYKPEKFVFGQKKKTKQIDVPYSSETPNFESDSKDEVDFLTQKFIEQRKHEEQVKQDNTDSCHYCVLCFKNRLQLEEFYEKAGIDYSKDGIDGDCQILNGLKVAKKLKIDISDVNLKTPGKFKCNKEILEMSMDIE
ncbi:MAG: hypothetical protein LBK94_13455 [Prevotellaceae bacterium]|jgi:PP-loop superfamily ATP-utilizing enzyme|nr:hypothetical protein [Prevotellaceae bacterium]